MHKEDTFVANGVQNILDIERQNMGNPEFEDWCHERKHLFLDGCDELKSAWAGAAVARLGTALENKDKTIKKLRAQITELRAEGGLSSSSD